MIRRSRDQMLMMMAEAAAGRSTCSRLHVGAVIASYGRVISTGYNGAPAGLPHCQHDGTEEHCFMSVHAEINAIIFAARYGVPVEGAELFTTAQPCPACSSYIINAGISRVVFGQYYANARGGLDLLDQAHVDTMYLGLATYPA